MSQIRFADAEYAGKREKTRREFFPQEIELMVPWKALLKLIEPHYPLESMLRVRLMQNWFALSNRAVEEALYEIFSLRNLARLPDRAHPGRDDYPELQLPGRSQRPAYDTLKTIYAYLSRKGLLLKRSNIVDATIITALSSTKNADDQRDPEMHQTKKSDQWFFGMEAHIAVGADSGRVHTVITTAANEADVEQVGVDFPGPGDSCVGQGVARNRRAAKADVLPPFGPGAHIDFNVAQRLAPGQLGQGYGQELIQTRELL